MAVGDHKVLKRATLELCSELWGLMLLGILESTRNKKDPESMEKCQGAVKEQMFLINISLNRK